MEYKKIEEFIKDKKLDKEGLVGKNILVKHFNNSLEEYEIVEIVPSEGEHLTVLIKLRSIKTNEKNWQYIAIKNIIFVRIADEKKEQDKDIKTLPSIDDRNEYFRKLVEAIEKAEQDKPFWKPPVERPQTIPYRPEPTYPPLYPIICHTCGLDCSGTMGYCCPNHYCPMGMGPILCKTTVDTPQSTTIPVIQSTCSSQNTIDDPVDFNKID